MKKPRLLDLFCKAGGATKGYQRAGFYVVGVDKDPQPHYCGDEFYWADALTYPLNGFDAYHASPPCQKYTVITNRNPKRRLKDMTVLHPDLIAPTRERLLTTGMPYVIENVVGAKDELITPIMLCGQMFGLGVWRHRLFECSFPIFEIPHQKHIGKIGDGEHFACYGNTHKSNGLMVDRIKAMQIDWMNCQEIAEAIPPAYTEYIGKYLMKACEVESDIEL